MRRIFSVVLLFSLSSCYLLRAYKVRHFNLSDHERLPSVTIHSPEQSFQFTEAGSLPQYDALKAYLDTNLQDSKTAAFLVIRNDSIIYEHYFNGFDQGSLMPSFSVAKSFVGTLVGIAVGEGKIASVHDPITRYLPELAKRDTAFSRIRIQHLLDMRSGIKFREGSYNLQDDAIKLGFRKNILKHSLHLSIEEEPGQTFRYKSVNTQLLGLIVERAVGKKLSAYMEEKLWVPLGAEQPATWNVDSKKRKQEIAFASLNATARDFAKLGRLYLKGGNWEGKQIISRQWVEAVANRDSMEKAGGYKNQWWSRYTYRYFPDSLEAVAYQQQTAYSGSVRKFRGRYRVGNRTGAFSAQGILNQVVYINPANRVVIVRLGRFWHHPDLNAEQFVYTLGTRL